MNKIMIKILKISGIAAGVGLVLVIAGIAFGGLKQIKDIADATKDDMFHVYYNDDGYGISINDPYTILGNATYKAADVETVEITAGGMQINIENGEGDSIVIESPNDEIVSGVVNGKLSIGCSDRGSRKDAVVKIIVPADFYAEEWEISAAGAKLEAEEINTSSLHVNIGGGIMNIQKGEVEELSLNLGAGEFDFTGDVKEDMDIDCAMGNVVMKLKGTEKDFNYNIDCGMGNVEIGSIKVSGLSEYDVNNNADKYIIIDCGIGNIDVRFAE